MSHGGQIRRARVARGWTQAELGHRVGLSQGRISQIENGGLVPTALVGPIRVALDLPSQPEPVATPIEPTAPRFLLAPPGQLLPIQMNIEGWARPKDISGDFHSVRVVGSSVLVVAGDIAGHGLQAFPGATYVQGLLHGVTANVALVPDLQAFAESVLQACLRVSVTGAFAFALFRLAPGSSHRVIVDVVSFGYPEAVVLDGPRLTSPLPTLRSEIRSSIGGDGVQLRYELTGGWRLVLASDGTLDRLGLGNESDGRLALLNWQRGPRRDEPLERFMVDGPPVGDDESLLLASWRVWDDEVAATVEERTSITDFVRKTRERVAAGSTEAIADRFVNALVEATANACTHARDGRRIWLRFRDESGRFVVEVEDRGLGMGKGAEKPDAGIAYAKDSVDVDFRRATPNGTICTLSIAKESK